MFANRRTFLLASGGSLASLTTLPLIAQAAASKSIQLPQPPPPAGGKVGPDEKLDTLFAPTEKQSPSHASLPWEKRVGFAIVGLGHLSIDEILPAFASSRLCKPVALVSGDREKAKRIAAQYQIKESSLYSYETYDQIAQNPDVQVIYIVLPNSMHKEFTLRGAAAGKHILCEKPMSVNAEDAKAMVDACKKADRKLMIAYRQQYEPNNRWIRQMILDSTFGRTRLFDGQNFQNQNGGPGLHQWRHSKKLAGGGALPDIGLYCLNGVRYLTGEEPNEVYAMSYSTPGDARFKEVEESFTWQMKFPSGLMANCSTSYSVHNVKRFRFSTDRAWFGMDPGYAYKGLKSELSYAEGQFDHRLSPNITEENQFGLEMDHMADCVLHNKAPQSPGEEGWQDHVIMDALYESARTNRPITLKTYEGRDHFRNPKSLMT